MTPKNIHKIFIPQKYSFSQPPPKNIDVQSFEPPPPPQKKKKKKKKMGQAYVYMNISEYPNPGPNCLAFYLVQRRWFCCLFIQNSLLTKRQNWQSFIEDVQVFGMNMPIILSSEAK